MCRATLDIGAQRVNTRTVTLPDSTWKSRTTSNAIKCPLKVKKDLVFDWLPVDRVDDSSCLFFHKEESSSQSTCTVWPRLGCVDAFEGTQAHVCAPLPLPPLSFCLRVVHGENKTEKKKWKLREPCRGRSVASAPATMRRQNRLGLGSFTRLDGPSQRIIIGGDRVANDDFEPPRKGTVISHSWNFCLFRRVLTIVGTCEKWAHRKSRVRVSRGRRFCWFIE